MPAISLTGTTYTESFDSLTNTAGSITNITLPQGWEINESGAGARDNEQYAADTGASETGDTYSYGSSGSTDRAIGGLRSGTLIPTFGASFANNTGSIITALNIAYTGEEWRLGTSDRTDRLDFQYSLDATSLTTGTWIDVDALDFTTPNTTTIGAKDGNATANKTAITSLINGLSIASGATFWVRWNDIDSIGANDGLAIDNFSLSIPSTTPTVNLSVTSNSSSETTPADITITATASSAVSGDQTVTLTVTGANITTGDYTLNAATTNTVTITILSGQTTGTATFKVVDDALAEGSETATLTISNPSTGITLGTTTQNIAIADNEVIFNFSAPTYSVIEGNTPGFTANATVRVTRAGSTTGIDSVTLQLTDGTAKGVAPAPTSLSAINGPSTASTPYFTPLLSGVAVKSILTVDNTGATPDDTVAKVGGGSYSMVGNPDGLGAFDNGDGTFTLLINHELGNTAGVVHDHGAKGAFVSRLTIKKSTLSVVSGEDLIKKVYNWDPVTQSSKAITESIAFSNFCSADLPSVSAYYNSATGLGTQERIFMSGEESSSSGYQLATVATGANKGNAYILGKFNLSTNGSGLTGVGSWENALANPFSQDKTIVIGNNDGAAGIYHNSVAVYVGTKQSTGTEIDKAGLTNGTLKFVNITGSAAEIINSTTRDTNITSGTAFSLSSTASTTFSRPEDGAWNPLNPSQYFFVTTDRLDQVSDGVGPQIGNTRLWRLNFTDITNPDLGGTIDLLIDGDTVSGTKVNMFDNITVDRYGHILLQEDVGGAAHNGKIWQYDIATDSLKLLAKHDSARFGDIGVAATSPFTQDEESSGIIDVQDILGAGWFLSSDQAHYVTGITAEQVQGGQLLALFNPDTYADYQGDYNNTPIVVTFAPGETFKDVQIPVVGDTNIEGNEIVNLTLINPSVGTFVGTTQPTAVLTIQNDDLANNAPAIITNTNLPFDANPLDANGWLFGTSTVLLPTVNLGANQSSLNTNANAAIQAGFFRTDPVLDRTLGYNIKFTAQILSESREASANKNNDGLDDRAGFSVIATGNDFNGLEIGFFSDRIWVQQDGVAPNLFTQAESVSFDTTKQATYTLTVLDNKYTLQAKEIGGTNATATLYGRLRNYSTSGATVTLNGQTVSPYAIPNFIFFGDDTTSARASFNLSNISVSNGATAIALPSLAENSTNNTVVGTIQAVDIDGNAIAYSITGGNTNGAFAINNNGQVIVANSAAIDFETNPNFNLTVQVSDGTLTDTATVAITLANVSEAPTVTSGAAVSFAENGTGTVYTATATDSDAGQTATLVYSLSGSDAALFNINSSTGAITFKNAPNFEAPIDIGANNVYEINAIASDGSLSDSKGVAITVTNVNEAPIVSNAIASQLVDTSSVFSFALPNNIFTDPEGDTLTYSATNIPAGLSFNSTTKTFTGTAPNTVGTNAITVQVNDGNGNTNSTNFNIFVKAATVVGNVGNGTDLVDYSTNTIGISIVTGDIAETIKGGSGADKIQGAGGNDIIFGNAGNDRLYGEAGDDILYGGLGTDNLWGGIGSDTFVLQAGQGRDIANDFVKGTDTLGLSGGLTFGTGSAVTDVTSALFGTATKVLAPDGVELMRLLNFTGTLTFSDFTTIV